MVEGLRLFDSNRKSSRRRLLEQGLLLIRIQYFSFEYC